MHFVMRRIVSKEGGDTDTSRDYEYTDWAAVDAFAREFVAVAVAPEAAGFRAPATAPVRSETRA